MTLTPTEPWGESEMLAVARVNAERAFAARTAPSRGVVWWAALIAVTAIATIAFAFVYSYFYLRLGAEQWPLEGTSLRSWQMPGFALGAVVAALVIGPTISRGRLAILAAGLLGLAGVLLQVVALAKAGYAVDANAYEALVVTIDALAAVVLTTALVLRGATVVFGRPGRGPNALHEADVVFFVGFAAIWVTLWLVIHVSPRVL